MLDVKTCGMRVNKKAIIFDNSALRVYAKAVENSYLASQKSAFIYAKYLSYRIMD